jgi:hypothetical protein
VGSPWCNDAVDKEVCHGTNDGIRNDFSPDHVDIHAPDGITVPFSLLDSFPDSQKAEAEGKAEYYGSNREVRSRGGRHNSNDSCVVIEVSIKRGDRSAKIGGGLR